MTDKPNPRMSGLMLCQAGEIIFLTWLLWDASLSLGQMIGLVAVVSLLYLQGVMFGMLITLAKLEKKP